MKIQNLTQFQTYNKVISKNINQKPAYNRVKEMNMPNFSYQQAFLGGDSLDLSKVYASMDKEKYPPDILLSVEKSLKQNNGAGKTLYDIHFEKYKGVLDCYSLEELKEKYPEFQDVLSVNNVDPHGKGFIWNFLSNGSEVFAQDEDLTLQLIKLYWGQGFSLNDLSKYVADNSDENKGINLYHTMKKLNIPLMNSHYAHVLKFSNKEYNENFTSQMSIKLRESKEARQQALEGEAVVIPRGPLSEAHKRHISESLKKYYLTNPDAVYALSRRQKDFYEQNPEAKEDLSIAMEYAWNKTQEGMSVKKYLTKFMKKFGGITEDELSVKKELTDAQKNALQSFWDKNGWAKGKFSIAAKKGWDYVKSFPTEVLRTTKNTNSNIFLHVTPTQINKKMNTWAKSKGYKLDDFYYFGAVSLNKYIDTQTNPVLKKRADYINEIAEKYEDKFPVDSDMVASSMQLSLIDFKTDLEQYRLPDSIKKNPQTVDALNTFLEVIFTKEPIYTESGDYKKVPDRVMTVDELLQYYVQLAYFLLAFEGGAEIAEYLNEKLDSVYNLLQNNNQGALNKIFIG